MSDLGIQNSSALRNANTIFTDCMAHSARMIQQINAVTQAMQEEKRRMLDHQHKAEEATIELNEVAKKQNVLLREEIRHLKESAKSDRIWKWVSTIIAIIGVVGSILGIIF